MKVDELAERTAEGLVVQMVEMLVVPMAEHSVDKTAAHLEPPSAVLRVASLAG